MGETANIIIADTLQGLGTDAYCGYLAHALCLSGICRLMYNGEERELRAGDLMIVRKGKLVENSTFRRFSRKGHLYRIGLCGAEYTTEQLRHERATFPISQSYHVPDYRTARAMSPGF